MSGRLAYLCWGALLIASACTPESEVVSSDELVPPHDLDGGVVVEVGYPALDAGRGDAGRDAGHDASHVEAPTCPDGIAKSAAVPGRRNVRSFTPTIGGVTTCGDFAFVSSASTAQVLRVALTGTAPEIMYMQGGGLFAGLTCDDRSRVYVADLGYVTGGAVVQITKRDVGMALPNLQDLSTPSYSNVLAVKGLGVYASDTGGGRVVLFREDAGAFTPSVVGSDLGGARGLARGADGRLYVALDKTFPGADREVVSFAIAKDGTLDDRQSTWQGPHAVDGIAIDEDNALYLALYSDGLVVRARDNLTLATSTHPTSLAFHGSTLLFTDSDREGAQLEKVTGSLTTSGNLFALDLGVCGAP